MIPVDWARRWEAAADVSELRELVRDLLAELRPLAIDAGEELRLARLATFASGRVVRFVGIEADRHPIARLMLAVNESRTGHRGPAGAICLRALRELVQRAEERGEQRPGPRTAPHEGGRRW